MPCRAEEERLVAGRSNLSIRAVCAAVVAASAGFVLAGTHAAAAIVTVPCTGNNATDVAALKTAISLADIAGNQTLSLGAGCTFTLSTIDNGDNGLPEITSAVGIQGNGDTITRSSGGNTPLFRFFETASAGNLTITGLTLTNGAGFSGGAISGTGPVTVSNSTFSGNNASDGDGGAIFNNAAVLTVGNTTFTGNATVGRGGAIASEGESEASNRALTVTGSTFSGNQANTDGGGIYTNTNNATVVINSTFNNNSSKKGGAIYNDGTAGVTILDSTIAGNVASIALSGGGIANTDVQSGLTVTNTIVADNTAGNCGSATGLNGVTDGGHNLENGTSCGFASAAVNAEPVLGTLQNNGGPTFTMAITSTSPAYSKASASVCAAATPNGAGGVDQRGDPRKTSIACDIGAFEVQPVATPTPIPVPPTGAGTGSSPASLTGVLVAGVGLALVGLLMVVGRRRGEPVP
jgi:predicted outer membrane repeat protein